MGAPSSVSPRLGRASAHGRPDAAPGNMLRLVLCAPEPARSDPRASLRRAGPVFRPMKNPQNIPEEAEVQWELLERGELRLVRPQVSAPSKDRSFAKKR